MNKQELQKRIWDATEQQLSVFLPADHHKCIPGLMKYARMNELDDDLFPDEGDPPDEFFVAIAKNITAQHMVAYAKEQADKVKAPSQAICHKSTDWVLFRHHFIEYKERKHHVFYLGPSGRSLSIDIGYWK